MIPRTQLQSLKPLQDIKNRNQTKKGQLKKPAKKLNLTKQQRNFAEHPNPKKGSPGFGGYTGPANHRVIRKAKKKNG